MHKLAIAATVAAALTAGGIVIATTAHSGDARASGPADSHGAPSATKTASEKHGPSCMAALANAQPGSLPALFAAKARVRSAVVAHAVVDCAAVGQHLADLESETGQAPSDLTRCASDYTSLCEAESWGAERRTCVIAASDLLNAHLCAFDTPPANKDGDVIPAELACATVATHMTPIVQAAGFYADVPDFAQQIETACDAGNWSIVMRQCFASAQNIDDMHGCIQPRE